MHLCINIIENDVCCREPDMGVRGGAGQCCHPYYRPLSYIALTYNSMFFVSVQANLHCRGNVDVGDPTDHNPKARLIEVLGWTILLLHIVGRPPKIDPTAATLIRQHRPDIVVFGHSHKAAVCQYEGVLYVNPGSAGDACHVSAAGLATNGPGLRLESTMLFIADDPMARCFITVQELW